MRLFRFVIDENLRGLFSSALKTAMLTAHIIRVGDHPEWPLGMSDYDLLHFCAQTDRILITVDRKSMPGHWADFHDSNPETPHPGAMILRHGYSLPEVIEHLKLIVAASTPDEYVDRLMYLP
jgi:hypothetical protein